MGCTSSTSVVTNENNTTKTKKGKNKKNNKEVKKEKEEQDKNIEERPKDPPTPYETFDWNDLRKKLPVAITKEEREERLKIWKQLNEYGNGYMSFKRLYVKLTNYLDLPEILRNKDPIKLAFDAAIDKYARYGVRKEDNLLE